MCAAFAMEEVDCFCVEDQQGNKVCEPPNCDANKPKVIAELFNVKSSE